MISIIIPTYNRATYILETLHSIKNQTYKDFECIIIDDGSTDNTNEVISDFLSTDSRFKYYHRPDSFSKGANGSRNYGFSLSTGSLIKFFDSDDLMLPEHLEKSIKYIEEGNYDFVVGDSINFDKSGLLSKPYNFDRKTASISAMSFTNYKVAWITNDLLVKRQYAEQCQFAEGIRDQGSEHQFNIHILLLTTNGYLIDEILSHRRIHDDGFVEKVHKDLLFVDIMNAELYYVTALNLKDLAPKKLILWLLDYHLSLSFKLAKMKTWPENIIGATRLLLKYKSPKAFLYPVAIGITYLTGKGYQLIKFIRS
ncbi:family 2 glycosyl transferase [Nonlabens dokdonensis]|uniref:Family 2 glycosyl transferase n=1 Tax=Nonlabens dokdonensis TaxID=328515 RepID=A0A1Z8B7W2_9FLAO|nr:glycosyltransferase family 2 protein [Nonlabens dokdonensis]OUS18686.1 family 2 glycosyl transferase [Nonlabens dokdonensis]